MPNTTAKIILDREFLEMRSRILELAAAFDRVERAGEVSNEIRWQQLQTALQLLLQDNSKRAENVQLLFSRSFETDWRTKLSV